MRIYIPSYRRGTAAELSRGPLTRLPPEDLADTFLVVRPGEVDDYRLAVEQLIEQTGNVQLGGVVILDVDPDCIGIGPKREWIGRHALGSGCDRFAMMDDDVDLLVRRGPDDWRLRAQEVSDTRIMLAHIDRLLDRHAMVGVSSREGNNRVGVGDVLDESMVQLNTRIMRIMAVLTETWVGLEHGRVQFMEDFDLTLQMLRRGGTNACLYYYANGQRLTNAPGGCSEARTRETHEASARRLAELHAPHVRLRQKENKTDSDGLGTRTEVTIAWKRAAAEGATRGQ